MTKKLIYCLNCNTSFEVDIDKIGSLLDVIQHNIKLQLVLNNDKHIKTNHISQFKFIDLILNCCDKPNYYYKV